MMRERRRRKRSYRQGYEDWQRSMCVSEDIDYLRGQADARLAHDREVKDRALWVASGCPGPGWGGPP